MGSKQVSYAKRSTIHPNLRSPVVSPHFADSLPLSPPVSPWLPPFSHPCLTRSSLDCPCPLVPLSPCPPVPLSSCLLVPPPCPPPIPFALSPPLSLPASISTDEVHSPSKSQIVITACQAECPRYTLQGKRCFPNPRQPQVTDTKVSHRRPGAGQRCVTATTANSYRRARPRPCSHRE